MLKSSQKYSTDLVLSSEEESLAEFITGLDPDSSEDAKVKEYMKKVKVSNVQMWKNMFNVYIICLFY